MADRKKDGLVEEQRKRQQELLELKKKKQEFEQDMESFEPEGGAVAVPLKGFAKVKHFFHYSKGIIAFTLIVCIIMAVGFVQCAKRTKYDCTVVLYSKHYAGSNAVFNLSQILEQYCEDTNGDGEVNVLVMDCAIPDEESGMDTGRAKKTRLMAQFSNPEAIVYIVDKACLTELDQVANGVFVDDSLELPLYDGKAYQLNGSVFDLAFENIAPGYSSEFEYFLIRRCVEGTAIEDSKNVEKFSEQGNRLIEKIVADPELKEVEELTLSNGIEDVKVKLHK